jgi:hypothetical protein
MTTDTSEKGLETLIVRHLLFACVSGAALALAGTVLGSDPEGAANLAGKAELPAGAGLAAQFPGDAGLKTHSDVIFADDFETGAIGVGWDETRNKDGKVLQFAAPGDAAGLGQRCLRVEAHLGKDTGGGLTKWFEPADPIFIRSSTTRRASLTASRRSGLMARCKATGRASIGARPRCSRPTR